MLKKITLLYFWTLLQKFVHYMPLWLFAQNFRLDSLHESRSVTKIKPFLTGSDLFDTLKNQWPLIQASVLAVAVWFFLGFINKEQWRHYACQSSLNFSTSSFISTSNCAQNYNYGGNTGQQTILQCADVHLLPIGPCLTIQTLQTGAIIINVNNIIIHFINQSFHKCATCWRYRYTGLNYQVQWAFLEGQFHSEVK